MKPEPKPLTLWVLDDGKPGHRNQSLGLVEALERQAGALIRSVSLPYQTGFFSRIKKAREQAQQLPRPDLIIAAGHRTHIPLIYLANQTGARSVVLMRPSLPCGWFDHCLIPEHDFTKRDDVPENVILTKGALNRVTCNPDAKDGSGLFLIGGESKEFGFDGDALAEAVRQIESSCPDTKWALTDSRRTPEGFIERLKDAQISLFPHQQTDANWLPRQLEAAAVVWVTEDSVSMIYEALSSGARVGLLPLPRSRKAGRVTRGIESLIEAGFLYRYESWLENRKMPSNENILAEAERCAQKLIECKN